MAETHSDRRDRMGGPAQVIAADGAAPFDLHLDAAMGAVKYSQRLKAGGSLRFPWEDIHATTGPLMPGWLGLIGGRGKAGKSTFLREVFNYWVECRRRVLYVGTEQDAAILKLLWACLRLRFPAEVAFLPHDPRHERVLDDVTEAQGEVADLGIMVADPALTLAGFVTWARYAYTVKAEALILDHFHRLECEAGDEQGAAIRQIKNMAAKSGMVVLVAAQLKQGEGGPLGEYEVPGPQSWAGTAGLQRECDLALQLWRPFKPGIERGAKQKAREDSASLQAIVQRNVMAVRCSAHRYRSLGDARTARLYVQQDQLLSWDERPRSE